MALYSKKVTLSHVEFMASSAGTLSKSSYLLGEVTGISASDGSTKATIKYSLYGSSSKKRTITAEIYAGGKTVSKKVTVTTSMSCLFTTTITLDCAYEIKDPVSASLSYSETKSGEMLSSSYGITSQPDLMTLSTFSYVTFGALSTYPSKLVYGESGTFQFSKSTSYRLEFFDSNHVQRYSTSFTGASIDVTIPSSIFQSTGENLTSLTWYELNGSTVICQDSNSISITETKCSLTLSALRNETTDNPDQVIVTASGDSASASTSRTITLYAKETSASEWTKLTQTISPNTASFTDASCTVSLSIDYAWDIYGVLEDGYTSAQSAKIRIYSKSYIMDVRTDGKGIAFGGTAANSDELYCGFKNLRANNISPSDITGIANLIYPVGSIYMSVNSTSPATLFGGTWEMIEGRFLLASGGGYSAGSTGGEAAHTLTIDEMPLHHHSGSTDSGGSHSHSYGSGKYVHLTTDGDTGADTYSGNISGSGYKLPRSKDSENYSHSSSTASGGSHTHSFTTGSAGSGTSHNNMPPYLVVNIWKRTA
jgi:microcystin-dependent protein